MTALKRHLQKILCKAEPYDDVDEVHHDLSLPTLRVLPIRDSITVGVRTQSGNGCRKRFAELLNDQYNVVFCGTETNGTVKDNHMAGWNGATIAEVTELMKPSLGKSVDAVLVHIGTNDCNPDPKISRQGNDSKAAANRLVKLLDTVLKHCPHAVVFVAKIVGTIKDKKRQKQQWRIDDFNALVPVVVGTGKAEGKKVECADMSKISGPEYLARAIGGVHPNQKAYDEMARIWKESVEQSSAGGCMVEASNLIMV